LLSLLPTFAAAAASALLPLAVALVTFAFESVTGAKGECRGGQAVGEIDLRADGVGEVRYDEDVLDVVVAGKVSESK